MACFECTDSCRGPCWPRTCVAPFLARRPCTAKGRPLRTRLFCSDAYIPPCFMRLSLGRSCYPRRRAALDGVFTHGMGWEVRPGDPADLFAGLLGGDLHHFEAI